MGGNQSSKTIHSAQLDPRNWERGSRSNGKILCTNKNDPSLVLEEYFISVDSEEEFKEIQEMYELRRNDPELVSSHHLKINKNEELCSKSYNGQLYLERIPINLSNITHIPFPDVLHIHSQSLNGFERLSRRYGNFMVNEDCIGVNNRNVAKVWHSHQFNKIEPSNKCHSQQDMVFSILDSIQQNTNHSTLPPQDPSISNFIYKETNNVGFSEAKRRLEQYANLYNRGVIPSKLSCAEKVGGAERINSNVEGKMSRPTSMIKESNVFQKPAYHEAPPTYQRQQVSLAPSPYFQSIPQTKTETRNLQHHRLAKSQINLIEPSPKYEPSMLKTRETLTTQIQPQFHQQDRNLQKDFIIENKAMFQKKQTQMSRIPEKQKSVSIKRVQNVDKIKETPVEIRKTEIMMPKSKTIEHKRISQPVLYTQNKIENIEKRKTMPINMVQSNNFEKQTQIINETNNRITKAVPSPQLKQNLVLNGHEIKDRTNFQQKVSNNQKNIVRNLVVEQKNSNQNQVINIQEKKPVKVEEVGHFSKSQPIAQGKKPVKVQQQVVSSPQAQIQSQPIKTLERPKQTQFPPKKVQTVQKVQQAQQIQQPQQVQQIKQIQQNQRIQQVQQIQQVQPNQQIQIKRQEQVNPLQKQIINQPVQVKKNDVPVSSNKMIQHIQVNQVQNQLQNIPNTVVQQRVALPPPALIEKNQIITRRENMKEEIHGSQENIDEIEKKGSKIEKVEKRLPLDPCDQSPLVSHTDSPQRVTMQSRSNGQRGSEQVGNQSMSSLGISNVPNKTNKELSEKMFSEIKEESIHNTTRNFYNKLMGQDQSNLEWQNDENEGYKYKEVEIPKSGFNAEFSKTKQISQGQGNGVVYSFGNNEEGTSAAFLQKLKVNQVSKYQTSYQANSNFTSYNYTSQTYKSSNEGNNYTDMNFGMSSNSYNNKISSPESYKMETYNFKSSQENYSPSYDYDYEDKKQVREVKEIKEVKEVKDDKEDYKYEVYQKQIKTDYPIDETDNFSYKKVETYEVTKEGSAPITQLENLEMKYSVVEESYNVAWDPEILADLQANVHN